MAVSARSIYLDSSLQERTLVAADGRSTTTNSLHTKTLASADRVHAPLIKSRFNFYEPLTD